MTIELTMNTDLAGIRIPDSKLAREITELVRDTESALLFHHSSRVYYFGALWQAGAAGSNSIRELLYAGAMFHDMGLTPQHSSQDERFEIDGANAARDFLRNRGIAQHDIDTVWTAIALHTTPGIPQHMHPVVALVTAGVEMDVLGLGVCRVHAMRERKAVVARASAHAALQGRHHPGLLRRHQAQAGHDLRQRQGRRARGQGSALHPRQFLQRHPRIRLARVSR